MGSESVRRFSALTVALVLVLAACGGDDGDSDVTETVPPPATTAVVTAAVSEAEEATTSPALAATSTAALEPSPAESAVPQPDVTATTPSVVTPTSEPEAAPTDEGPQVALRDALPALNTFPTGWTAEYPEPTPPGENTICDAPSVTTVTTIVEEVEANYAGSNGVPRLLVTLSRMEDADAAMNLFVEEATCTEFDSDGVTWALSEMSFPDMGDGQTWARSATVTNDGNEFPAQIVAFRVKDVMVMIVNLSFLSVDTDLTVSTAESIATALD